MYVSIICLLFAGSTLDWVLWPLIALGSLEGSRLLGSLEGSWTKKVSLSEIVCPFMTSVATGACLSKLDYRGTFLFVFVAFHARTVWSVHGRHDLWYWKIYGLVDCDKLIVHICWKDWSITTDRLIDRLQSITVDVTDQIIWDGSNKLRWFDQLWWISLLRSISCDGSIDIDRWMWWIK